jgi:hypothetical protein
MAEKSGRFSAIGLAKWKLDRFVSADGPAEGGSLTTVPLRFRGNRLEVNARTRAGGQLEVEVLDAAGRGIPGAAKSDPFHGDNLRAVITWKGRAEVDRFRAAPVSLRFHLKNCQLYSFAFRDAKV